MGLRLALTSIVIIQDEAATNKNGQRGKSPLAILGSTLDLLDRWISGRSRAGCRRENHGDHEPCSTGTRFGPSEGRPRRAGFPTRARRRGRGSVEIEGASCSYAHLAATPKVQRHNHYGSPGAHRSGQAYRCGCCSRHYNLSRKHLCYMIPYCRFRSCRSCFARYGAGSQWFQPTWRPKIRSTANDSSPKSFSSV